MRSVTLVVRVPVSDSGRYMVKVRQVVDSLSELDFRTYLLVEHGDSPVLVVQGEAIDLGRESVGEIVRRILSSTSVEVSDPDMLEKLAGAGLSESGEEVFSEP